MQCMSTFHTECLRDTITLIPRIKESTASDGSDIDSSIADDEYGAKIRRNTSRGAEPCTSSAATQWRATPYRPSRHHQRSPRPQSRYHQTMVSPNSRRTKAPARRRNFQPVRRPPKTAPSSTKPTTTSTRTSQPPLHNHRPRLPLHSRPPPSRPSTSLWRKPAHALRHGAQRETLERFCGSLVSVAADGT